MFEYYNNILCVQASWLYNEACVLTKSNYDNLIKRNKVNQVRRGGNGRKALISYESIPKRFKDIIIEKFGNPEKTTKKSRFASGLSYDEKAKEYFAIYPLANGSNLPEEKQRQYVANACIFNRIHELVNETKSVRGRLQNLWNNLPGAIANLPKDKWPHTLDHSSQVLKRKYSAYILTEPSKRFKRVGLESLIHAGFCNNNTLKIKGSVADWWLAMYAQPNKQKVSQIIERYNLIKDAKGFPALTEEAVYKWLHKPEQQRVWFLGRHGAEAWKNKYSHYITRKKDNWFPNSYWAIDGSKIDWVHYEDNVLGMAAKLKIDPVVDVFSEKIIGWSISETENHIDHFQAFKMAVNNTGSRPYYLTYDNQSGHKSARMQELYSNIVAKSGGTHHPNKAKAHNSPVEGIFNRLQQQVVNQFWFSDKQSPTVRTLDNKPNVEFLKSQKHHLKSKDQLIQLWEVCVKLWNDAKHPKFKDMSRSEVYEMEAPMSEAVSLMDKIDMFWIFNNGSKYRRGGIKLQVANREYEYEVLDSDNRIDIEFRRKYVGSKLIVKYDPDHLNEFVALYEKNDQDQLVFVANAQPKRQHQNIPVLMQEGDKDSWKQDYDVVQMELERDMQQLEKVRAKTGITPEKLIEEQEILIKMGGEVPKEVILENNGLNHYINTNERL